MYPYCGMAIKRNLFAKPESYERAECSSEHYLSDWRESRQALSAQLENTVPPSAPAIARKRAGFDAGTIFASLLHDQVPDGLNMASARFVVDALTQKFEIFRRLYDSYDADLKRTPDATLLHVGGYVTFGHVLATISEKTGSPKYLSTLLKLVDALGSVGIEDLRGDDVGAFRTLIDREANLVAGWIAVVDGQK